MGQNLPPEDIYQFIVNDFEDAWNSLAWNPSARARGGFMFALQAMILLEFAARLCSCDSSETAVKDLSAALYNTEPKYFTPLPGICANPKELDLPYKKSKGNELLWAIFDLIRNGQTHQYQQILVDLADGLNWGITLYGADFGKHLQIVSASPRPKEHLGYRRDPQRDLWLLIRTDVLFLDLKKAINVSGLLNKGLQFQHLTRPQVKKSPSKQNKQKSKGLFYQFDSAALESSLAQAGHSKDTIQPQQN
ncbi:hypothetical protein ACFLXC_00180 [Chloroflexota bacterium]